MPKTIALIAATAATLVVAAAPAAARAPRAFDDITAAYDRATGDYCIRSGWGHASGKVRPGACHTIDGWRSRGIHFDRVAAKTGTARIPVILAQR